MRELTLTELQVVSGGDLMPDPSGAVDTFIFLVLHGDQEDFIDGTIMLGMGFFGIGGFILGAMDGPLTAVGVSTAGMALGGLCGKLLGLYASTTYYAIKKL